MSIELRRRVTDGGEEGEENASRQSQDDTNLLPTNVNDDEGMEPTTLDAELAVQPGNLPSRLQLQAPARSIGFGSMEPLYYSAKPKYDLFFMVAILFSHALLAIIFIVLMAFKEFLLSSFILAVAIFIFAIYYVFLPRKFVIYRDRIVMFMGPPIEFGVRFDGIIEAKCIKWRELMQESAFRIKFGTSLSNRVIIRRHGWNILICPKNSEAFVSALNLAVQRHAARGSMD